nr:DNA cytosine methyltransferase [uncultured Ruminococcus sp.]
MAKQINLLDDIFVDNFAGGGGASTGIELATGQPVTIAINHDDSAIMMHKRNHPFTEHYQENVWNIDPKAVVRGRHVRLAWFSPDCKHFSRAKGAALVDRNIRGLAWVVLRWAALVRPDVIMLENVPEFVTWGPVRKGKRVKSKEGQTYRQWKKQLEDLGYQIETSVLCAADYGAPTIRKRFCLVARCDGQPIVWPIRTHAPADSDEVKRGKLKPWRSAASVIDFSISGYSIFKSKEEIKSEYGVRVNRPLKPNTLRRIAKGLDKFVLRSSEPFIVECNHSDDRIHSVNEPLATITAMEREGLTAAYLSKFYGGIVGAEIEQPLPTVTSIDHNGLTAAYLTEFYGNAKDGAALSEPLHTVTSHERQGLIHTELVKYNRHDILGYWDQVRELLNTYAGYHIADGEILLLNVGGDWYYISDITLRMLTPRELYDAMGFPHDYMIDKDVHGEPIPRKYQVARCGNAVCPPMARALVQSNLSECKITDIQTMTELHKGIIS